jgi:hypothetical protein
MSYTAPEPRCGYCGWAFRPNNVQEQPRADDDNPAIWGYAAPTGHLCRECFEGIPQWHKLPVHERVASETHALTAA